VTDERLKLPLFLKASLLLIGLIALIALLYLARSIIVPVIFALIIAIVLHPVVNFIIRIKINRVVAILITIFLTFLVIVAFGTLIISQVSRFSESLPVLVDKFTSFATRASPGLRAIMILIRKRFTSGLRKPRLIWLLPEAL